MKFIYKINSGYNGFTPNHIVERLKSGRLLTLGWRQYIEVVEPGHAVWVYFRGPHDFTPGVYAMGTVRKVNVQRARLTLHVHTYATDRPLTRPSESRRLEALVKARHRQVFILRSTNLNGRLCTPERCKQHQCGSCPVWKSLATIGPRSYEPPKRLARFRAFAPALWVIPSRCYLNGQALRRAVHRSSELFYDFKIGEAALAYPLAKSMHRALKQQGIGRVDCVVPIPLSPDKERRGELHRTLAVAKELGAMLDAPVRELLQLKHAVSKRRIMSLFRAIGLFRKKYAGSLVVGAGIRKFARVLLVDDVCTHGNTLERAAVAIQRVHPDVELIATTAGQMIVKEVVRAEGSLRARGARRAPRHRTAHR